MIIITLFKKLNYAHDLIYYDDDDDDNDDDGKDGFISLKINIENISHFHKT